MLPSRSELKKERKFSCTSFRKKKTLNSKRESTCLRTLGRNGRVQQGLRGGLWEGGVKPPHSIKALRAGINRHSTPLAPRSPRFPAICLTTLYPLT